MKARIFLLTLVSSLVFLSSAHAFLWVEWEHGDAGNLPWSAQTIYGSDAVEGIKGKIVNYPGVDMYELWLSGGKTFSATVTQAGFDTQLFLFNSAGFGVYANDNLVQGNMLSSLPAGDMSPEEPGLYYLAISRYDRNPRNSDGRIFRNWPRYTVHNADGPGADLPISGWSRDDEHSGSGRYCISLTGAYGIIPEPATLSLLGLGLLGLVGLKKRRA